MTAPAETSPDRRVARWARRAAGVGLLVALALLARFGPLERGLAGLEAWVQAAGPWGPVAFGVAYVVAALALVPGSVLTLAAGALFGPLLGTLVVSIASTTSAALAFALARTVARDLVEEAARRYPAFGVLARVSGDWQVAALLRLSPVVPFSLANYLFGLTPVRFGPYLLVSWAAMLPGTALYVTLGHAGRATAGALAGDRARTPAEWALLGVGLAATLLVSVLLTRRARAALAAASAASGRQD